MANLRENKEIKFKLMLDILQNDKICKAVDENTSSSDLVNKNIFPYLYVPDTNSVASTFICLDMYSKKVYNSVAKESVIEFTIFTHQSLLGYNANDGFGNASRIDELCALICEEFNNKNGFGLGYIEFVGDQIINITNDYRGKRVFFNLSTLNRGNENSNG